MTTRPTLEIFRLRLKAVTARIHANNLAWQVREAERLLSSSSSSPRGSIEPKTRTIVSATQDSRLEEYPLRTDACTTKKTSISDDDDDVLPQSSPEHPSSPEFESIPSLTREGDAVKPLCHIRWIKANYATTESRQLVEELKQISREVVREFSRVLKEMRGRVSSEEPVKFSSKRFVKRLCGERTSKEKNATTCELFLDFYDYFSSSRLSWHIKSGVDVERFKELLLSYKRSKREYSKQTEKRQRDTGGTLSTDEDQSDEESFPPLTLPSSSSSSSSWSERPKLHLRATTDYSRTSSTKRKRI